MQLLTQYHMQISDKAVMRESQVQRILGADHSAPSYCQLALCARNSLLGKSHLTSCYASNDPEDNKRGFPVQENVRKKLLSGIYLG